MGVEALVAELERDGVTLAVVGEEVRLRAPATKIPPSEMLAELRQQKAAILTYLRARERAAEASSAVLQDYRVCQTAKLKSPPRPQAIPADAVLLAPRYNGGSAPLDTVPECWCCATPYRLDRTQEWQGKTYAWLEPDCRCLAVPQAIACCGLCWEHCQCSRKPPP